MGTRAIARIGGAILAVVVVAAVVWAFWGLDRGDLPTDIPSYALESSTVLRVEWALALIVASAIPVILIGRLLSGRFPSAIGTRGAEWAPEVVEEIEEIRADVARFEQSIDGILDIVDDLQNQLDDHERRLDGLKP